MRIPISPVRRTRSPKPGLLPDQFLVNDTPGRLKLLSGKITAVPAMHPATGVEAAIIQNKGDAARICREAGLLVWGPRADLALIVASAIRRHARCLLTLDLVDNMLTRINENFADLVRAFLQRAGLGRLILIHVLRELLEEEVSIRDMLLILDSLCTLQTVSHADTGKLIVFQSNPTDVCLTPAEKVLH